MPRLTSVCNICNSAISLSNFKKHQGSKKCLAGGKQITKSSKECKFCLKYFDSASGRGVHEVSCDKNPDKKIRNITKRTAWNKGQTKYTNESVAKGSINLKNTLKNKPLVGCFAWSKEKKSEEAKKRKFGGYRENAGRSKKYQVLDSFGKQTTLQSSYEYKCFEILSELSIRWIRPKALKYNGRNYFADFYLVDYNIYLDPKNNYKAKLDSEKIQLVREQNQVNVFIILEKDLNKEFITGLI